MNEIRDIDFDIIFSFWKYKLWPDRISPIESHSAMLYMSDNYDIGNFLLPVWYLGYVVDNKIIGVNSGHLCVDGSARSRGLWVDILYRGNGIGIELLRETIKKSKLFDINFVWSFCRQNSKRTYESAGFTMTSEWIPSETNVNNCYCRTGI